MKTFNIKSSTRHERIMAENVVDAKRIFMGTYPDDEILIVEDIMDYEGLLKQLGFTCVTGNLWENELVGIIYTDLENDRPEDIVKAIYDKGYEQCQIRLKKILGIT